MTRPIYIVMVVVALVAGIFAVRLHNLTLGIFAVVLPLFLLVTALGPGRMVSRCAHFTGRAGSLQTWGATPQQIVGTDLILERVWALGAGVHFRVAIPRGAVSVHIKVAQPRQWSITPDTLTIADAKYVQVDGKRVEPTEGAAALQFLVTSRV